LRVRAHGEVQKDNALVDLSFFFTVQLQFRILLLLSCHATLDCLALSWWLKRAQSRHSRGLPSRL
jgi:hypothetical protein